MPKKTVSKKSVPTVKSAAKKSTKKKAASKTSADKKPAAKKTAPKTQKTITAEERYQLIQDTAYYLAEKNKFEGDPSEYWLKAEQMVDKNLKG